MLKQAEATKLEPKKHSQYPIVSGGSVLGLKYNNGVMMIADTLGSYGSLAMFPNLRRMHQINKNTFIGASGEYSDYQEILREMEEMNTEDFCSDDGHTLSTKAVHHSLTRWMYNMRSKVDPLYNQVIVAGHENGKSYLGVVDMYGSSFEDNFIATGFGMYLAMPILRKGWRPDLSENEAKLLLEDCMKVLFYRDCRAINKFTLGKMDNNGINISEPYSLETQWEFKAFVNPDQWTA